MSLRPRIPASFLVAVLILLTAASSLSAETSTRADLIHATWRASLPGMGAGGLVCWIGDAQGNLRGEVLLGRGNLADALDWQGHDGWTLVALPEEGGTMNRWGESWDDLPPALEGWFRLLVHALTPDIQTSPPTGSHEQISAWSDPAAPRRGPFDTGSSARKFVLPGEGPGDGFRAHLAARGLGKGGSDVTVTVMSDPGNPGTRRILSSRHPGHLEIILQGRQEVGMVPETVFLPWWPLGAGLDIPQ